VSLRASIDEAELGRWRLRAQTLDISGEPIVNHLDAQWAAEMLDPNATFGPGALRVTSFTFEPLVDSYSIFAHNECEFDDPATFALLNGNCNGVFISNFFALTLVEMISATAWPDPDDGTVIGLKAVPMSFNATSSTQLLVELVTGNTVNYYVRDFSGTATPANQIILELSDPGGWVRDTAIKNADMIRFTVPQSLVAQFPDLGVFPSDRRGTFAVQNGAVRRVGSELVGDNDPTEGNPYNGIAINQVLDNFSRPAAPVVNFFGQLDIVEVDTGGGIYSGTPLGTNIFGFINPDPTSGEITNGTIQTTFGCCIAAGGLSVTDNELLDADTAALLNNLAGSPLFSAGDIVDIINIEGDTATAAAGRIEIGLSYIFNEIEFSNESLDNYPFDPNEVLLSLFFIAEFNAGSGEIYSAVGKLD